LVSCVLDFAGMTQLCAKPDRDNLYRDTQPARQLCEEVERVEKVRARDYDWLEAGLVRLATDRDFANARKGYGSFFAKEVARDAVFSSHRELVVALQAFAGRADADLAATLHGELRETVDQYEALKQRSGALDFVDLLIRARDLVRDCDPVRADLQRRFTHIFVDEFQDTDPLQAEILLLLSAADPAVRDWRKVEPVPGKLFIVGDPKQSIYRFRRADVGTYIEVRDHLRSQGAEVIHLTTSFRALPSIQRAMNAAFAPLMKEDPSALQAEYVALAPYRTERNDQPTLIALPVPRPYGKRGVTATAIEASLPDAVGAFVEWLLKESHWTVSERGEPGQPEKLVPLTARHVCLLFRRFDSFFAGDITRGYVRALEARGVPHLLVGGKSFHAREEVETIRVALSAIEWPDDQLSVFATLRGSLFSIGDEELLEYRHRYGRQGEGGAVQLHVLHPFRIPPEPLEPHLAPIVEALRLLASLHRGRNRRPISETVALLLEATRGHAGFALRPAGEQVLANVLHVGELAQAYETSGGISFRSFVEQLTDEAGRAQTAEAPILEEGSDGVRIMTTHRAKGLEFPVVILADITARLAGSVSRYIDTERKLCALRIAGWAPSELIEQEEGEAKRDEAEGLRIAYVAATRARDLLVVPVVGDAPFERGWVSCLNGALYPEAEQWSRPALGPACPEFGRDSVVERPADRAFDPEGVRPGLHVFGEHDYGVVWWDPHKLELEVPAQYGIRQQHLLGKRTDEAVVGEDVARFEAWRAAREAAIEAGSRPSMTVRIATERSIEGGDATLDVKLIELPRAVDRPSGPRFGALVHAVLAVVALDSARAEIERSVALQARILGATPDEAAAAIDAVEAALAHPLMERARAAHAVGKCRRETPVTLREENGDLVEGVVDLAFEEDGIWTVVDFKTDAELVGRLDPYRRQVGIYAAAIAKATGKGVVGALFRV
jgi:ATP-dependent exoDNAse (exonuclease V) beta subunit